MAMNITNIGNINGFDGLMGYAVDSTSGLFFGIIVMSLWVVIVVNTRKNGIEKAVASASFACLLISVFLVYRSWLNILYPVGFTLFLAGSLFVIRFKGRA